MQTWAGSGGLPVSAIGVPFVRFNGSNSAPQTARTLRVAVEYSPLWVSRSLIERRYQPLVLRLPAALLVPLVTIDDSARDQNGSVPQWGHP